MGIVNKKIGNIRVKAQQRMMNVGSNKGKLCFQMSPQMYSRIMHDEIVAYAAKSAAVPESSIDVAMEALADAVAYFVSNGHSVKIPGIGTFGFSVRCKTALNKEDVKASLVYRKRLRFTPCKEIKEAIKSAGVSIELYDEDGNPIVKEQP